MKPVNRTNMTYKTNRMGLIPAHGGYRKLMGIIGLIGLIGLISPTASANSDYLLQNSTINIFLNEPEVKAQTTPFPSYKVEADADSFLSVSLLNTAIDFGIVSPLAPVTRSHDLEIRGSKGLGYSAFVQGQAFLIPDTSCDQGLCSGKTAALWTNVLTYGFGFRCDNLFGKDCSSDFKQEDFYRKIPGFSERLNLPEGSTLEKNYEPFLEGILFSDPKKSRVTYKVNVAKAQEKGVYQTNIFYIVLPSF